MIENDPAVWASGRRGVSRVFDPMRRPPGHNLLDRLVEWWPLGEQSSTRMGAHAGLHLGDVNTVTGADGVNSLASQFTASNSEYLERASESALQMGDSDFTVAAWVYADSLSGSRMIATKDDVVNVREWQLGPFNSDVEFYVFKAGNVSVGAILTGGLSTGSWAFLVGWHDASANTVNLEKNADGSIASQATGGSLQAAGSAAFQIGGRDFPASRAAWDGRIQRVGLWNRVLTADERAYLYNAGQGRDYPFRT